MFATYSDGKRSWTILVMSLDYDEMSGVDLLSAERVTEYGQRAAPYIYHAHRYPVE